MTSRDPSLEHLWPLIEAVRDAARAYAQPRGVGPGDTGVAMVIAGCVMLSFVVGKAKMRKFLLELADDKLWENEPS